MPKNNNYFLNNCVVLLRFINQPLFNQTTLLNPVKFWRIYQIRARLEESWDCDTIMLLERCLEIESEAN
jgi:hypothetical protein